MAISKLKYWTLETNRHITSFNSITFTPPTGTLYLSYALLIQGNLSFEGEDIVWIFDSYYKGSVELWARKRGLYQESIAYPQFFYLYLKDPHAYIDMIEALESRYQAQECSFDTIFGPLDGYKIRADRAVAEKIEKQTRYAADLYNVDIRRNQQYMAEHDMFPCGEMDESRFSPDFETPLSCLEIRVLSDPGRGSTKEISCIEIHGSRKRKLEGAERTVLSDFMELIKVHDPDVILFPYADVWTQLMVQRAKRYGIDQSISRSGHFRSMAAKSYWSYGKVNHKDGAYIPEGRVLIDTATSFTYREGGLKGVLLASRLSGLSPNLTARFTPGTLISSYEVYEALRRSIAIPFRKKDAERLRPLPELKARDKGGMMFQPQPGVREKVYQIDFTSLYPSIIVNYNLSPETMEFPERKGFLAEVLRPLLELRRETKRRKKSEVADPSYAGLDSVLKWMLVTCFGYTGYRNAKFGRIEVHEQITSISREILLQTKEIAEDMGFEVLHGIVDCVWVVGEPVMDLKTRIESKTGISTEIDAYDWIVFLPMEDGSGAYNRYYGRLSTGKVKLRGILARRGDTPEYIRRMQEELLEAMGQAKSCEELSLLRKRAREIKNRYAAGLINSDPKDLMISRRVSRLNYSRRCAEGSAVKELRRQGISISPGEEIGYVVRDANTWEVTVDARGKATEFDASYYGRLLDKAWKEINFALGAENALSKTNLFI